MYFRTLATIDSVTVARRLADRPHLAWLDGEAEGGRYSFLGSDPVEVCRVEPGASIERALQRLGAGGDDNRDRDAGTERPREASGCPAEASIPRWIGYLAYDALWALEHRLAERLARSDALPRLFFARYDALLGIDHRSGTTFVCGDDEAACAQLLARLERPAITRAARAGMPAAESAEGHRRAIEAALEAIGRGEIYQVNLARRWSADYEGAPLELWLAMRRASPVPLGFYVDGGDHAILASTMERFLRWSRATGTVTTRPIKGTIRRSGDDDHGEAARLRADDKELAEHAMIVDLMRNDLGRVARIGSVEVADLMRVEPYAGLFHLVSTVRARLRPDVDLRTLIDATFPPGSVTGTPKLRAIELIEALERSARGVYTGCVGHIDRAGGVSFAVAIRTAQVHRGVVHYHAGGGIVSASDPEREIAETELKAQVFVRALASLRDAGEAAPSLGSASALGSASTLGSSGTLGATGANTTST